MRTAFEAERYQVLGTATSGQAARALADDAHVNARTIASLLARLRTGTIRLHSKTVVLVDEAGMTDDGDLLAVLKAAEDAHAKVVVIGDHRQLSAVGPGGGLEALIARNPTAVHEIRENVRQHDPKERWALDHLRAGHLPKAIGWYQSNDRVVTAPTRDDAIASAVDRWHADVADGKTTLLLAWRRADVAALNHAARDRIRDQLGDDEYTAPGGRRYAVGDRVVALAPLSNHAMTTSERGTVTAVHDVGVTVRSDRGLTTTLTRDLTSADRLDHAYALTVHRAQGATVDRTHLLADGGGRELAYVAMSRARETSHVHVVADDLDQALEDLHREWGTERRDRWILDIDQPAEPGDRLQPHMKRRPAVALRAAQLRAERAAVLATMPPDPTPALTDARIRVRHLEHRLDDLHRGRGPLVSPETTDAMRSLRDWRSAHRTAEEMLLHGPRRRERRAWTERLNSARHQVERWQERLDALTDPIEQSVRVEIDQLNRTIDDLDGLQTGRQRQARWLGMSRIAGIDKAIRTIDPTSTVELDHGIEVDDGFGVDL